MAQFTKYNHVQRLGHEEVDGILGGTVFIQEKLDGACASVYLKDTPDGLKLAIASRNQDVSVGGNPSSGFRGLVGYVLGRKDMFLDYLQFNPHRVLRGEWLCPHSIVYNKDAYNKLYIYDVEENGRLLHPDWWWESLDRLGMVMLPFWRMLVDPKEDDIRKYVGKSDFGSKGEGIVIKNYDFVNQYGRTQWAKIVTEEFREENRVTFGALKKEPNFIELSFAHQYVTPGRVRKIIRKMEDHHGRRVVDTDTQEMIGRVWHDVFDELFDFIKKNSSPTIDFRALRKAVTTSAVKHYFDFLNGMTTVATNEE